MTPTRVLAYGSAVVGAAGASLCALVALGRIVQDSEDRESALRAARGPSRLAT